jgi:RND family efflux transporter MFP subunit
MIRLRRPSLCGTCGGVLLVVAAAAVAAGLTGCARSEKVRASETPDAVTVGVAKISRKTLEHRLTVSSELVPFQEVDVYAKESGYVRDLLVDYGSRVRKGQVMAVLEIPELEVQLQQDDAAIRNASDQVTRAEHELGRVEAQHKVLHLQFERLNGVAKSRPGLVAQQEVDDSQGKDLAAEAQVEASKSNLQAAQSQLQASQAKKEHDRILFDYSKITAPFTGVVTQRYANLGTLLQAGTSSSTQAMPLVRLSQDDRFRLVIPVPESYVRYIHIGDPVNVNVPSLNRRFPGKVARFSVDVKEDTRTMHTEVDVSNLDRVLIPGMYAEAALLLERKSEVLAVPLQAVNREGGQTTAYVIGRDNRIEDRRISLGLQTANEAEALAGLSEGDQVVVGDRSALKPGEDVRPQVVEMLQYQGEKEE